MRDKVGQQARTTGSVVTDDNDRLPDAAVRVERRFDLAQLDAETANLHLEIETAEEIDVSVGQPTAKVAGAVEPRRGERPPLPR